MTGEGSIGFFPIERAAQAHQFSAPNEQSKPFSLDALPYAHHIRRLEPPRCPHPDRATPEDRLPLMHYLQEAYLSLLDAMVDNLRFLHDSDPEGVPADRLKLGRGLSYNMLLTRKHMHIIPRREAIFRIESLEHEHGGHHQQHHENTATPGSPPHGKAVTEPAIIGCNSLAYTGTVLVKSSEDASRLSAHGGVLEALKHCGYPKSERSMPSIEHDAN